MITKKDFKITENSVLITTKVLCEKLQVTRETLSMWEEKGCPKIARGWWDLFEVLNWRGLIGSGGIKTSESTEKKCLQEQKLEAEIKYKESQIEINEYKNAISRGDYIARTEIISELQRFFITEKRSIQGISRMVATEVAPFVEQSTARRIENSISDRLINVLEQFSLTGIYDFKEAEKAVKQNKSKKNNNNSLG